MRRLVQQFKDQPGIAAILSAALRRAEELADEHKQLLKERSLDSATGVQLDGIGRIVGLPRDGRGDSEYRHWLRAQIRILRADGTPEDILEILAMLLRVPVRLRETHPAEMRIVIDTQLPPGLGSIAADVLHSITPAGVRAWMEWADEGDPVFCFAGGDGAGFGEGRLQSAR